MTGADNFIQKFYKQDKIIQSQSCYLLFYETILFFLIS